MTDSEKSQKPSAETMDIVDPLGEIRLRAKQLWKEDGEPKDKTWTDYWTQAEEELLGGPPPGRPSIKKHVRDKAEEPAEPLPVELQTLVEESDNPLLSAIASTLRRYLTEHEALCLTSILRSCRITLVDQQGIGPCDIPTVANILAALGKEYDPEFVSKCGAKQPQEISLEKRVDYWNRKLEDTVARDEPLTYSDRNTINRLMGELAGGKEIVELVFEADPAELA